MIQVVPDAPNGILPDLDLGRTDALALQVLRDPTPDLEQTAALKVGDVPTETTPDMELTARPPVGEIAPDATPDVERTQIADKEWTPDEEGPVLCRACRTPQTDTSSIFCQACGYRLPVRKMMEALLVFDDGSSSSGGGANGETIKCPQCGCKTLPGGLCSACGVLLRPAGT